MLHFFVDLKRFDVAREYGGICSKENPVAWAEWIVSRSIRIGLDRAEDFQVTYYFPESCLVPAMETYAKCEGKPNLMIGSEGLYRRDTSVGGDYGAMTGPRPASAMVSLGCYYSLVAHSDERRDKLRLMIDYDPEILCHEEKMSRAQIAVDKTCAEEASHAINRGMKILYCVGETAEQKGSDVPEIYEERVRKVLRQQIDIGLGQFKNTGALDNICLAYEPVWAIGPGRPVPDSAYVSFAAGYVKELCRELLGRELPVVYGGGLKKENAAELASVYELDGGFNGLTNFTPPIRFDPDEYLEIIKTFISGRNK